MRGIQIGLESTDTPTGQVGPLRTVQLRWFEAGAVLGDEAPRPQSRDLGSDATTAAWGQLPDRQKKGLWIDIRHEKAAYVALLLPGFSPSEPKPMPSWAMIPTEQHAKGDNNNNKGDTKQFVHLPLLLLRMPLALKNVIGEWLSTTFDCRVSKMSLGTKTIINVWESWIRAAGLPDRGPDFTITLGFNVPQPQSINDASDSDNEEDQPQGAESGLRSVEITISPPDLRRFVRAGTSLSTNTGAPQLHHHHYSDAERRRLAGGNSDDGWAWRNNNDPLSYPFTEALGRYLDHHLALNLFHPSVRVTQVSCSGFVLGQSRVKIVRQQQQGEMGSDLSRAAWLFITQLGERTRGADVGRVFS